MNQLPLGDSSFPWQESQLLLIIPFTRFLPHWRQASIKFHFLSPSQKSVRALKNIWSIFSLHNLITFPPQAIILVNSVNPDLDPWCNDFLSGYVNTFLESFPNAFMQRQLCLLPFHRDKRDKKASYESFPFWQMRQWVEMWRLPRAFIK